MSPLGTTKGYYFLAMKGLEKKCAEAAKLVSQQQQKGAFRVVGWLHFKSRSEERRVRQHKQVGKGVLGRVLLRIQMHRFPVFQWGNGWAVVPTAATRGRGRGRWSS